MLKFVMGCVVFTHPKTPKAKNLKVSCWDMLGYTHPKPVKGKESKAKCGHN
jgi:hypothetical protein